MIRDESIRTLAEALHHYSGSVPAVAVGMAEGILVASPTLATDLDLGTAWRMAQAALPDGWVFKALTYWRDDDSWQAQAMDRRMRNLDDFRHGSGPTPTEALVALAAALRERAR